MPALPSVLSVSTGWYVRCQTCAPSDRIAARRWPLPRRREDSFSRLSQAARIRCRLSSCLRHADMGYLALLAVYSAAQIALGLWIGRRVRTTTDFFVAGRRLGPGLIFSTMLA